MQAREMAVLVPAVIVVAVFLVIWLVSALMAKKAEIVCREIINSHFNELRLLNDCWLTAGIFPDKGILALLGDRMVFVSIFFNKSLEVPLSEVTGLKLPRFALPDRSGLRVLWVQLGPRRLKLSMNQFILAAWKTALEKASPMLAASGISAGIK